MNRTRKRILQVLDGVAHVPDLGKDILIVFDDEENYYRYVSYYYPEGGEYAFSGGMHISTGCSHFVTVKADLRSIEPVIAHEMTHGCVAHLPLPRWLDEGLAVNTERRLADSGRAQYTPQQMHEKHLVFWGDTEVQQFWSGESFFRADDGIFFFRMISPASWSNRWRRIGTSSSGLFSRPIVLMRVRLPHGSSSASSWMVTFARCLAETRPLPGCPIRQCGRTMPTADSNPVLGLAQRTVRLSPYTPEWASLFQVEAQAIRRVLGPLVLDVQHVGSTAIPGMTSKPILDIAVGVAKLDDFARALRRSRNWAMNMRTGPDWNTTRYSARAWFVLTLCMSSNTPARNGMTISGSETDCATTLQRLPRTRS